MLKNIRSVPHVLRKTFETQRIVKKRLFIEVEQKKNFTHHHITRHDLKRAKIKRRSKTA